ncbi:uncharacterized protein LOC128238637 [Mya arenaria]|uniref:uncharacterized protein LOC128238637 n=1 Tax=Mya arenaria TaxID=6604 RepID=UPI0022DFBD2D|nr:uncharacterized protein LOC128238637 [Mya arenaria]
MSDLFRCAGDIIFDDFQPLPGQISNVQLKKFAETSNFLQLTVPLTPQQPYFCAKIQALGQNSKVTFGIAGPDIDSESHPGQWNHTVGYNINTGRCFSSHLNYANTKGQKCVMGDEFGVLVTHFGDEMSTVTFLKNRIPVATRYIFEKDHCKFLPTICLENGPVDLAVSWPMAVLNIPEFTETNMLNWIKDSGAEYDALDNVFHYDKTLPEVILQSPTPLRQDLVHYEVVLREAMEGESPAVGIATCSPLWPTPTSVLLRDFFKWKADGVELKSFEGQRIGFGIHYNPDEINKSDFDDKKQQLVLCFVTMDMQIIFFRMMLQPSGGFYPLIVLTRGASKVEIDVQLNRDLGLPETKELLDGIFREKATAALAVLEADARTRELNTSMFHKSADIDVEIEDSRCIVGLQADKKRIHGIQFTKSLNEESPFFAIEIIKLNEDSVIGIGIGTSQFSLSKHPGRCPNSCGYISRDGKTYTNTLNADNRMLPVPFAEGDTVGVEVLFVNHRSSQKHLVVLFHKNGSPVDTVYMSAENLHELYPTLSLSGNGYEVKLNVFWQNRIAQAPPLLVSKLSHWCLPSDSMVDEDNNIVTVPEHQFSFFIQSPKPFNEYFNHYEINWLDKIQEGAKVIAPIVALAGASNFPKTPDSASHLRIDVLRFTPVAELASSMKVGDKLGWGMLIPESQRDLSERLVVCYLTVNRNIALTRVLFEPPGGFFPCVVLPQGVNKVKLDFSALRITEHPLTDSYIEQVLNEAYELYDQELECIRAGKDIDTLGIDNSSLFKPVPSEIVENSKKSESDPSKPKTNGGGDAMYRAVVQARAVDGVHKAVKTFKQGPEGSKACAIL